VDGGGAVLAERRGDRVGIGASVDDLDRVGDRACLREDLERDRRDLAVGRLAVDPDLAQTHRGIPSSVTLRRTALPM
jgi:hypothetical protein